MFIGSSPVTLETRGGNVLPIPLIVCVANHGLWSVSSGKFYSGKKGSRAQGWGWQLSANSSVGWVESPRSAQRRPAQPRPGSGARRSPRLPRRKVVIGTKSPRTAVNGRYSRNEPEMKVTGRSTHSFLHLAAPCPQLISHSAFLCQQFSKNILQTIIDKASFRCEPIWIIPRFSVE